MADVERVLQGTPTTLQQQWYEDGSVTDPGVVTIGITASDGTVMVAAGSATGGTGTNPRTFNITTTHTALLNRLTVRWTSSTKGTLIGYVEVVGGFLFSLADFKALRTGGNTTLGSQYTTAQLLAARTYAEQALEHECGRAFVPRYKTVRLREYGDSWNLGVPDIRSVRSVSVDGVAYTVDQLAALGFDGSFVYGSYYGYAYAQRARTVVVGVEHGMDSPPADISEACLIVAREQIVRGAVDDRALTSSDREGNPVTLAIPGMTLGGRFGLPKVAAACNAYRVLAVV
jgi:hypothetical protein